MEAVYDPDPPRRKLDRARRDRLRARAGPVRKSKRDVIVAGAGQRLYPAIQFENGALGVATSEMARTITEGRLIDRAGLA